MKIHIIVFCQLAPKGAAPPPQCDSITAASAVVHATVLLEDEQQQRTGRPRARPGSASTWRTGPGRPGRACRPGAARCQSTTANQTSAAEPGGRRAGRSAGRRTSCAGWSRGRQPCARQRAPGQRPGRATKRAPRAPVAASQRARRGGPSRRSRRRATSSVALLASRTRRVPPEHAGHGQRPPVRRRAAHDVGAREADEQHGDACPGRATGRSGAGSARTPRRRRRRRRRRAAASARRHASAAGACRATGGPAPARSCRRAAQCPAVDAPARLVLHHVVRRGVGVAVLVRPAVDLRDLAGPVAVRRRRGRRPLQAVRLPRVLAGLLALERAPEEVHEEDELRGAQDEGADGDELVDAAAAASGTRTGRDRRCAAGGRRCRCSASGRTCRSR